MKRAILTLLLALGSMAQAGVDNGKAAPDFKLMGHDGKAYQLSDFKGKTVVLEWVNEGCPFVKKHYDKSGNMPALQKRYTGEDVVWLSICSSGKGKQGYWKAPAEAASWKESHQGAQNAVLLDPDGAVGRLYGAKTTPAMYIIDKEGKLAYQGAIDSIASFDEADIPKATNYVSQALAELAAGKAVSQAQTKSYGCSVKYGKK